MKVSRIIELDAEYIEHIVVESLKEDLATSHNCKDFNSRDAIYNTLIWYVGHSVATKELVKVLGIEDD